MIPIADFTSILETLVENMPQVIFRQLNLGIGVSEYSKNRQDTGSGQIAYILGEYTVHPQMGRGIMLYYGSFQKVFASVTDKAVITKQIDQVLRHELLHHLEHLAGERELEIEDTRRLLQM